MLLSPHEEYFAYRLLNYGLFLSVDKVFFSSHRPDTEQYPAPLLLRIILKTSLPGKVGIQYWMIRLPVRRQLNNQDNLLYWSSKALGLQFPHSDE